MDTPPSNDQGIAPSQTNSELTEGVVNTPTQPEAPRYVADENAPIRRKNGGVSVLLIVLIVLGVFGLGGVVLVGGLVLAGALAIFTYSASSSPPAPPAPIAAPSQDQPFAPVEAKPPQKVDEGLLEPPAAPPNKAEKGKEGVPRKGKQP
jgi:hypothetical protein